MDDRLYFVLGDLLANIVMGALVGAVAVWLVGSGWNMWLAMLLMMALGMVLGLAGALGFGFLFGAMEIMVPVMQTGMWSGMVVGMWQTMAPLSATQGALVGGVTGVMVLNVVWVANTALRGVVLEHGETAND
jgi:hypothetical protein